MCRQRARIDSASRCAKGRPLGAVVGGLAALLAGVGSLWAGPILVPNGSFESPVTPFVNTHIDFWQKPPKPDWYVESGGYGWTNLTGVFLNTPATSYDHIHNCDGKQALWLFADPEVGLFQDYESTDWNHSTPMHAFAATFQIGASYELTVGVIGGGGNMLKGVGLDVSLYYRDEASNKVTVALTSITNSVAVFPNTTNLVDFHVHVPVVKASDAWAGRHIGIQLMSTVSSNMQGGYWDFDNVRLFETLPPALEGPAWTNGQFTFTVRSEAGLPVEILAATDSALPMSNWTSLATLTNLTGADSFSDTVTNVGRRFYRARPLP
jgi:hypothetical protein